MPWSEARRLLTAEIEKNWAKKKKFKKKTQQQPAAPVGFYVLAAV